MYARSTVVLALVAIAARLAVALPPACLLGAVNSQPNPADLESICGDKASEVQSQIEDLCGNDVDVALDEFDKTCESAGYTVAAVTSSTSSTSSSSSASSTGSSYATVSTTGTTTESATVSSATTKATGTGFVVITTSTYYDAACSCTKTAAIGGTASGSVIVPTVTASGTPSATGTSGAPGNVTVPSGPNAGSSSTSASAPAFTGAAARFMAGSGAVGAIVMAAGFAVAL